MNLLNRILYGQDEKPNKSKKLDEYYIVYDPKTNMHVKSKKEPENKDVYVWIEGYKATNKDMKCMNDFQYELGKEYTYNEEVKLCEKGFHFCKKLEDTFCYQNYQLINNTRYFKVKALVNMSWLERKEEYFIRLEEEGYISNLKRDTKIRDIHKKYVASKIIFTEELQFEDLLPYIKKEYDFINTETEWKLLKAVGCNEYIKQFFMCETKDLNLFGEGFLNYIYYRVKGDYNFAYKVIDYMKMLKEENLSKDMLAYLILTYIKD